MVSQVSQVHQEEMDLLDVRDLVVHQVLLDKSGRKANPDLPVIQGKQDSPVIKDSKEK